MPTYVILSKFTEKGVGAIKESPDRIEDVRSAIPELGGELKEVYGLIGKYDTMLIIEARDDEAAARISLWIGSKGNVHTMTMPAFTEKEFRKLCDSVPA